MARIPSGLQCAPNWHDPSAVAAECASCCRTAAQHSMSSADSLSASGASGIGRSVEGISRKRLFVVVHKAAQEEGLTRLFRSFPGMESCDLKRDRLTGADHFALQITKLASHVMAGCCSGARSTY